MRSIAYRCEWELAGDPLLKTTLLTYNAQDCEALDLVTHKLAELHKAFQQADIPPPHDVVNTDKLKREHPYGFRRNTFALPEFESINKAAYWDYQRERIYIKTNKSVTRALKSSKKARLVLTPNETIECPRARFCPICGSKRFWAHSKASRIIIDLKFMRSGIKRWIKKYQYGRYLCKVCGATFHPVDRGCSGSKYGAGRIAYFIYLLFWSAFRFFPQPHRHREDSRGECGTSDSVYCCGVPIVR